MFWTSGVPARRRAPPGDPPAARAARARPSAARAVVVRARPQGRRRARHVADLGRRRRVRAAAADSGLVASATTSRARPSSTCGRRSGSTGRLRDDEPYAEWALTERERLRQIASNGLRALADLDDRNGDLEGATASLQRLTDLEPYDVDVHRDLLAMLLRRGRRSEALRRYEALRRRMLTTFGEELSFSLADLGPASPSGTSGVLAAGRSWSGGGLTVPRTPSGDLSWARARPTTVQRPRSALTRTLPARAAAPRHPLSSAVAGPQPPCSGRDAPARSVDGRRCSAIDAHSSWFMGKRSAAGSTGHCPLRHRCHLTGSRSSHDPDSRRCVENARPILRVLDTPAPAAPAGRPRPLTPPSLPSANNPPRQSTST